MIAFLTVAACCAVWSRGQPPKKKRTPPTRHVGGVLDRFEGDIGVIYVGEQEDIRINLPAKYLPAEVGPRTYLKITIAIDEKTIREMERKVKRLQKELLNKSPYE